MKKIITTLIIFSTGPAAFAEAGAETELSGGQLMDHVAYGVILFTLILIIIAMLVLLRTVKVMSKVIIGPKEYREMIEAERAEKVSRKAEKKKTEGSLALKLLSLKPLSEEHTLVMEHEYDGIVELDNPTPKWFMYLFYASIVFAIGYLLNYHVLGTGQLQDEEYKTEVAIADKEKEAILAQSANRVDENTITVSTDAGALSAGKTIFTDRCAPCHGDKGQGVVGPNLTDDFWLNGGDIKAVFKTIKYGVPAKGMPTWEKQLSPKQIADVANYIKSIHGSSPPNAKEPQGEKVNE